MSTIPVTPALRPVAGNRAANLRPPLDKEQLYKAGPQMPTRVDAEGVAAAQARQGGSAEPAGRVRQGLADGVRAVGMGFDQATEFNGVATDHGSLVPVEVFYGAGRAIENTTRNIPVVDRIGKVGKSFFNILGFVSAFNGMILGGMLRAPGDAVRQGTELLADKIDGGEAAPATAPPAKS